MSNRITQESIETALLLLMEEKDFASISITEITSRADVSRTAYYRKGFAFASSTQYVQ